MRRSLLAQGVDFAADRGQFSLFAPSHPPGSSTDDPNQPDPLRDAIKDFDIDNSTPVETMRFLKDLKDRLS